MLHTLLDLFLHLDRHLSTLFEQYGVWTYALLFLVIFCETGLVITPFLPGDSLLFAVGALAARVEAPVGAISLLLIIAAILGDAVNYGIGYRIGPRVFTGGPIRFLNRDHLDRTHRFYEKHGGKTIVIARFVPILRTFAPFIAGIGKMAYRRFALYNVLGGVAWVLLFVFGGYGFGNLPTVRNNFTLVILMIIFISLLPGMVAFARKR